MLLGNDVSENLALKFPSEGRAMSLTPLPPPPLPPGKSASGVFLALPAMSGPLPTELKFKDNTGS